MTSLARRIQKIERITQPTIERLIEKLFAQRMDVKDLSDEQLDAAIAYFEERPAKRSRGRASRELRA